MKKITVRPRYVFYFLICVYSFIVWLSGAFVFVAVPLGQTDVKVIFFMWYLIWPPAHIAAIQLYGYFFSSRICARDTLIYGALFLAVQIICTAGLWRGAEMDAPWIGPLGVLIAVWWGEVVIVTAGMYAVYALRGARRIPAKEKST